jgi:hypothetical protein
VLAVPREAEDDVRELHRFNRFVLMILLTH